MQLNSFIGQEKIKNNLFLYIKLINSGKIKSKNILFYGPSGMGKTKLAKTYTNEINKKIKIIQGPLLKKNTDLISLLINFNDDEVLFIDEIHAISKNVEELLYSLFDHKKISIILTKNFSEDIIDINLPYFQIIGATTEISKLTKPFLSRFDYQGNIEDYSTVECKKIIIEFFNNNLINYSVNNISEIINYSNLNPRNLNKFLNKINENFILNNNLEISIKNSIQLLDIKKKGINIWQYKYLKFLYLFDTHQGFRTGANYIQVEENYLLNNIEPYLFKLGLITKTSNGRKITILGKKYIDNN